MRYETATDFAKEIGHSQQRYSNYERGDREPKILVWGMIRDKLGVTVDFIMFGDQAPRVGARAREEISKHIQSI